MSALHLISPGPEVSSYSALLWSRLAHSTPDALSLALAGWPILLLLLHLTWA
jgi:hypothetical protein